MRAASASQDSWAVQCTFAFPGGTLLAALPAHALPLSLGCPQLCCAVPPPHFCAQTALSPGPRAQYTQSFPCKRFLEAVKFGTWWTWHGGVGSAAVPGMDSAAPGQPSGRLARRLGAALFNQIVLAAQGTGLEDARNMSAAKKGWAAACGPG